MTRLRSNALTGPSDPRYLRADQLLAIELARPLNMDPTLRAFLRTVYDNRRLMAEPDDLAGELYSLYSNSDVGRVGTTLEDMRDYVKRLTSGITLGVFRQPPFLQHTRPPMTLAELRLLADDVTPRGQMEFATRCSDFIYFQVGRRDDPPSVRLYANIKFEHVPDVARFLVKHVKETKGHGLVDFKVVGPQAVRGRKDAMVIYCTDKAAAERLAAIFTAPQNRGLFNDSVPAMTTQVSAGVGVAIGAEPVWQATGMGRPKLKHGDGRRRYDAASYSPQSFGTIRCELIAMAVMNFNANKDRTGSGFDVFLKFVGVAFRGYGLDPARPGD